MTERKRFEIEAQRAAIFARDRFTCICGRSIYEYGTPQLAHRIAQSKMNIKKYGACVIHHAKNMRSACSLKCNDRCNIGNKPAEVIKLVDDIRDELLKE